MAYILSFREENEGYNRREAFGMGKYRSWRPAGIDPGALTFSHIHIADDLESDPHLYADDTNLLKPVTNIVNTVNCINRDLAKITGWATKWKVQMNPKKSKCILFSNKNKPSAINGVFMNGDPISIVTEVKHLGITLDRKLTWQSHIDSII